MRSLVTVSSDGRSQVLFIPERTHALAYRNKDEKGSYRFSKVCSGQAQNDRERWLVRFVGSCATGPVGSPLCGKYWCARANRLTLATSPRASLHVNPFAQIARTNRPIVSRFAISSTPCLRQFLSDLRSFEEHLSKDIISPLYPLCVGCH